MWHAQEITSTAQCLGIKRKEKKASNTEQTPSVKMRIPTNQNGILGRRKIKLSFSRK
jgi:hypothetical protein